MWHAGQVPPPSTASNTGTGVAVGVELATDLSFSLRKLAVHLDATWTIGEVHCCYSVWRFWHLYGMTEPMQHTVIPHQPRVMPLRYRDASVRICGVYSPCLEQDLTSYARRRVPVSGGEQDWSGLAAGGRLRHL